MNDIGKKLDSDKDRWDLLPLDALEDTVKVLTFGAKKYSDNNWKKVERADNRYFAACLRHLKAWQSGEIVDVESKVSHLGHAICCLIFLSWFEKKGE